MRGRAHGFGEAARHALVLSLAVPALLLAPAAAAQGGGLFGPVETEDTVVALAASTSVDDVLLRQRAVSIDLAKLARARAAAVQRTGSPAILGLNLFDDVEYEAVVERTAPTFSGGYSISARIAGDPLGSATLVVNGETVAGTVRTLAGTYRIRSAGEGRYTISQVDLSKLPEQCEVLEAPRAAPE